MEDVEIVDVNDDGVEVMEVETASLENQDLSFLNQAVGELLAQYGWYLLVVTVLVYVLIQQYSKRRASKGPSMSSPGTQPDPVSVVRRQEALEASRQKMQEEHDAKAAQKQEKQKQLDEEKRRQKIEMWENMQEGKSYKRNANLSQATEEANSSTTVPKPKTGKKPLRSTDYNPLTGDGGASCSWRPGRRGPSSGG